MQWNRKLAEIGSKPRVGIQIMMSVEFLFQPPLVTNMKLEYELVEPQTWGEPTRQETLEKVIHPLLTFSSRQFWTHTDPHSDTSASRTPSYGGVCHYPSEDKL